MPAMLNRLDADVSDTPETLERRLMALKDNPEALEGRPLAASIPRNVAVGIYVASSSARYSSPFNFHS